MNDDVAYCPNCSCELRWTDFYQAYMCISSECAVCFTAEYLAELNQDKCTCSHPPYNPPCHHCTNFTQGNKEMKLNRKNFAEFFRNDFYTVRVKFVESMDQLQQARANATAKEYVYKVHKDVKVEIGDRLLVCVSNDPGIAHELKVVVVFAINLEPEIDSDSINYKWIVGLYNDVIKGYLANVEQDQRLKRAVAKLEQKLEQVSLRKQLAIAMDELDDEDKKELTALFGTQLLGPTKLTGPDGEKN